jgi:FkbM family methyltransferase
LEGEYLKLIEKKILDFKMCLDTEDCGISKELIDHGIRERFSVNCIKSILKPDMNVLDLGANIGFYALIESKLVNHVYAIEPVKYNFNLLKKNIKLNNLTNISTYQVAIGGETKAGKIYTSARCNWATIVPEENRTPDYAQRWDKFKKGSENVPIFTLDDFMKEYQVENINLLRMDVEGAELEIISGGINTIKNMPDDSYLVIEIHSSCIKDKDAIGVMLDRISEAGFKCVKVVNRLKEFDVSSIPNIREFLIYRVGCPQVFFQKI